jgi:hypothetical protein
VPFWGPKANRVTDPKKLTSVCAADHLRFDEDAWRKVTAHMAGRGMNMVVIDIGEALVYPSHPELAIKGSWTPDRMRDAVRRLNTIGLEAIPKLNFSTTHNGWMGDYSHMASTRPYYRMCEEVFADVAEIFGHPRFFHIGFDEERASFQENEHFQYICVRLDEFWWKDFLHIVQNVEKHGARAWMWSDHAWYHEDFYERCPKSVVQQNWFYDSQNGGFDPATNTTSDLKRLQAFLRLDEAGFDQVPCGTNWPGGVRRKEGIGADDVIGKLVKFGRENISKDHLMGFMMATWEIFCWDVTGWDDYYQKILHGIDLYEEALK